MPVLRRLGWLLLAVMGVLLAYLLAWPVPIEPVAWPAPQFAGYVGPHAANDRLARLERLELGGETGPEHVAFGPDGKLYAAVSSGAIVRMNADGSAREVFARTGGRPLGFDFDRSGRLIVADAWRGLLAIDASGRVEVLVDKAEGAPILYADAVVVATSGKTYFTDASRRFSAREYGGFEASVYDIFEQQATGRVLEFDPAMHRVRELLTGLSFANGIALSADERSLFVIETGNYRVWKLAIDARVLNAKQVLPDHPQARVLLANLPGYPDNLMRGLNGRLWIGFAKPRGAAVDKLAPYPFARKIVMRLPRAAWPVPPNYGHVIAFTEDGRIVADLQDPSGAYPQTTGVTETADRLYIQSLVAGEIGWRGKAGTGLR